MTTFVLLATLTPQAIRTVNRNPERINAASRERLGVRVVRQPATPGEFDLLSIAERPTNARCSGSS